MKMTKYLMLILALMVGAGAANAVDKTINLSVSKSQLFVEDRPFLSFSEPISAEEKSVLMTVDMKKLVDLAKNYHQVEQNGPFYREKRNFRNAVARIIVHYVDGSEIEQRFEIKEGSPTEATVKLSKIIEKVSAKFVGESDTYKCFDANTCIFEGAKGNSIRVEGWVGINRYRSLIRCDKDVLVEGDIYKPHIQRVVLSQPILSTLSLSVHGAFGEMHLEGNGETAVKGEELKGLTRKLYYYDISPPGTVEPSRLFYMEREKDALKLRVENKAYSFCIYEHKLYPDAFPQKRSKPLDIPCPLEDSLYRLKDTAPGIDKPFTKEVVIEGCVNLP